MTKRNKILIGVIFVLLGLGCFKGALSSLKNDRQLAVVLACVGGVSIIISSVVCVSALRRKQPTACPKCQSAKVIGARVPDFKVKELGLPKFTILGYQMCQDCHHIWERRTPLWAWYTGLAIGVGLFVPLIYVVASGNNDPGAIYGTSTFATFGFIALVGSIRGLVRAGRTP